MTFAFLYPGQGSQSVGMLSEMAQRYPQVTETFSEASEVLGIDLWALSQSGPEDALNKTEITQPALLTAGVASWRVWLSEGGQPPVMMAGHSLGEYTALVCSGAMDFSDAVAVVADRGRYMQEAVPEGIGSMAAILGLDDSVLVSLCEEEARGEVVSAANFNSPGQTVIAGHKDAVERVVEAASAVGAKRSIILPVSVPSHCALMEPAAEKLSNRLENVTISAGNIPVLHNVDVAAKSDPAAIKAALVEQLSQPVRWVETIEMMIDKGIGQFVECGPGKVLSGLIKRIDRKLGALPLNDANSVSKALAETGHEVRT